MLFPYNRPQKYLLTKLVDEWRKVDNKLRFILMVINGELVVAKKKKATLLKELKELKFHPFPKKAAVKVAAEIACTLAYLLLFVCLCLCF